MPDGAFREGLPPGQVLLTRLIQESDNVEWERAVIAAAAVVLSNEDEKGLLIVTLDYRRQVEISEGSFELGDWPEFANRYGHVLLWTFARMRFATLVDAVVIRYVVEGGRPYCMPWPCTIIASTDTWLRQRQAFKDSSGKRRSLPPVEPPPQRTRSTSCSEGHAGPLNLGWSQD